MKTGIFKKRKALSQIEEYWTDRHFHIVYSCMFKKVNFPNNGCRVTEILKVTDRLMNKITSYPGRP